MLVKLLKNDYYNRGKALLSFCVALILDALILKAVMAAKPDMHELGPLGIALQLVMVMGVLVLYVSFPALIFGSVSDFGKRYFKDQGYFTHTLPVKTSVLLMARMVADIINTIIITITYLFIIEIMSDGYGLAKELINSLKRINAYRDVTTSEQNLALLLRCLVFFIGILFALWQYNAAYAMGHSYNSGKRIKSVGFFILIYIIEIIILSSIVDPIGEAIVKSDMDEVQIQFFTLAMTMLFEIIGVTVMGMITNNVCRKGLNLE